ncbi:MAG TPA: PD-(D/E)XK nuclease family protein, partial [Acidimicrobiales bacterium]|nr:PD-(D/E)XK nuclease family protein [Acidimicrobiales bacterium]
MAFEQPLPGALSPSRLNDFQACPRRYQHASVERIPQPASYASTKGRFVHHILEQLFHLDANERTLDAARRFTEGAEEEVLTDEVRADLSMDEELLEQLRSESDDIVETYFRMEDPRSVRSEGAELRLNVTIDETPLLGILDRLDRDEDGSLA